MSLSPTELRKLKDAFNDWAKNMPNPNEPVLGFFGSSGMRSAKEVAKEVENETAFGKDVLEMVEHALRREGMDKTVARITHQPQQP
jgi:hypothetical protein